MSSTIADHHTDAVTARQIRQFTQGPAHHYPLYYFIPSITADARDMIVHHVRDQIVQLHRLDLVSGQCHPLTDAADEGLTGWAIWCDPLTRGVYNHLSALNLRHNEVCYFQDTNGEAELWTVNVTGGRQRRIVTLTGRLPIAQNAFSPDGETFVFIHTDRASYLSSLDERTGGLQTRAGNEEHEQWRRRTPVTVSAIDRSNGVIRDVLHLDFHVHHVLFLDDRTLLFNHLRNGLGMWTHDLATGEQKTLGSTRADHHIVHQVITRRGVLYEAVNAAAQPPTYRLGRWDPITGHVEDYPVPAGGYLHTGHDPEGLVPILEDAGPTAHTLMVVRHLADKSRRQIVPIRDLSLYPARGQRYHGHPFLGPAPGQANGRDWLYHTACVDGTAQVCAVDVADLVRHCDDWRVGPV